MLELFSKVQYVKGVGPRKAEALAAVGITTVSDLLFYLPFRYEDRSRVRPIRDLRAGEEATVLAKVLGMRVKGTRRPRLKVLEWRFPAETWSSPACWSTQEFLKDIL